MENFFQRASNPDHELRHLIRRLAREFFLYGTGNVLNQFIAFLLLPLFTAFLSPKDFGIISILGFISFIVVPVFGMGFNVSLGIVYFEKEDATHRNQTVWTSFTILLLGSIFIGSVVICIPDSISDLIFRNNEYGGLIILWLIGSLLNGVLAQPFKYKLQFEEKARIFIILAILSTLITSFLSVLFVAVLKLGVKGFVQSVAIGNFLSFCVFFLSAFKGMRLAFDVKISKKLLSLGIPMIPSFVFLFVLQHSGRYFLQLFNGLGDVGIYTVGFNIGMVVNLFVNAFQTAWYPYFNSFVNKKHETEVLFGKILTYYVFTFGTICFLFFAFSKPVVHIMTQRSFHDAWIVVGPVAFGYMLNGMFVIFLPGVYYCMKVYLVNFVQFCSAFLCLLLNLLLIKDLNIAGAAISFMAANFFMMTMQHLLNVRLKLLRVIHEWDRIFKFGGTFTFFLIFLLIPRDFSIEVEIMYSFFIFALFLVAVLFQLKRDEKEVLLSYIGIEYK